MINTIVAACLQDMPHAPMSSEPRVLLPALGRFHTQCTQELMFNLQPTPYWDWYQQSSDLAQSRGCFCLAEHPDAYSFVSDCITVYPNTDVSVHMRQPVWSWEELRPKAETYRAAMHSGIATEIYSGWLVERADVGWGKRVKQSQKKKL